MILEKNTMKFNSKKGVSKTTIVCIHGNSSSSKVFDSLLNSEKILQTVIAVDLPGHGVAVNEKLPEEKLFSFYKGELINFINTIEDDIILIGNSLGGHLAIEISQNIPKLKGLVIMGTPPLKAPLNFEEAFNQVEALQTFLSENPNLEAIKSAAKVAAFIEENREVIISDFKKANPIVRSMTAASIMNGELENEYQQFIDLKIPKLIIRGKQDPSPKVEYLNRLVSECKNASIKEFKNCGHYPSLEQPKQFIEEVNNFVKNVF